METHETLTGYAKSLKNIKEPNWKPDNALIESVRNVAEKCVFICGHMKSGTSLLVELLDGHPELIVMPGDSRMTNWINKHSNMSWTERLREWDLFWVSRLVNSTGQKPFWIMGETEKPYVNFLHYLDYWLENLTPSDSSPFLAVVLAFYCANPRRPLTPKLWVEKNPGNEMNVQQIMNLFPSARFIHIIRDPLYNLTSLKKRSKIRKSKWDAIDYISRIRDSIKAGFLNQKRLGQDRYYILRYEDLVKTPETEMRNIASFLGIKMDKILLFPTVNGLPAKSNTMFQDRKIQGQILNNLSDKWRAELDTLEQKTIRALLYSDAQKLGYKWSAGSHNWIYYLYYYPVRVRHHVSRILRNIRKHIAKGI